MTNTKRFEDLVLVEAKHIIESRMAEPGGYVTCAGDLHTYLQIEYTNLQHEEFGCLFLNANYGVINHKKLFRGTVSSCATYPREIAREALLQNAVYVALIHNHPAGSPTPTVSDKDVTIAVKTALAAVDIVLIDHFIVAGTITHSMWLAGELG